METNNNMLDFKPLTLETWNDFEEVFGERGACGGCWCMAWRLKNKDFGRLKGEGNKHMMHELVKMNEQIGIIAYQDNKPAGWCSVAPRENFIKLDNSKVLKRIDDQLVWSITCLFVLKQFRRMGYSVEILKGAVDYCRSLEVKIIEAYPVVPYDEKMPAAFAWTGLLSAYLKAGFTEAERRSPKRPIVRYYL
jgi:GNAT superfamily N-acetyltransferase